MKRVVAAAVLALSLSSVAFADDTADLWKAKCKSCHGEDGKADTKMGHKENMHDISQPAWQDKHSDDQIRDVITNGSKDNKKMKPFKEKLTPAEIDSLVKYVRTLRAK